MVDHRQVGGDPEVGLHRKPTGQRHREVQGGEMARAVRDHRALGHRRGARGVEDLPDVVGVDLDVGLGGRHAVQERPECHTPRDRVTADGDRGADPQAGRGEGGLGARPQLGVDDGQTRFDLTDQVLEHVRGEGRVDRHRHHPRLRDTDLRQVGLDRVLAEQENPCPGLEPRSRQGVGDLAGDLVRLAVGDGGEPLLTMGTGAASDRGLVRVAPGQTLEHVPDRGPFPPVHRAPSAQTGDVDLLELSLQVHTSLLADPPDGAQHRVTRRPSQPPSHQQFTISPTDHPVTAATSHPRSIGMSSSSPSTRRRDLPPLT